MKSAIRNSRQESRLAGGIYRVSSIRNPQSPERTFTQRRKGAPSSHGWDGSADQRHTEGRFGLMENDRGRWPGLLGAGDDAGVLNFHAGRDFGVGKDGQLGKGGLEEAAETQAELRGAHHHRGQAGCQ